MQKPEASGSQQHSQPLYYDGTQPEQPYHEITLPPGFGAINAIRIPLRALEGAATLIRKVTSESPLKLPKGIRKKPKEEAIAITAQITAELLDPANNIIKVALKEDDAREEALKLGIDGGAAADLGIAVGWTGIGLVAEGFLGALAIRHAVQLGADADKIREEQRRVDKKTWLDYLENRIQDAIKQLHFTNEGDIALLKEEIRVRVDDRRRAFDELMQGRDDLHPDGPGTLQNAIDAAKRLRNEELALATVSGERGNVLRRVAALVDPVERFIVKPSYRRDVRNAKQDVLLYRADYHQYMTGREYDEALRTAALLGLENVYKDALRVKDEMGPLF